MARFAVNPPWPELPRVNALLHGYPRAYLVHEYRTTLSIKTVVAGEARYATPGGRYLVTPDVFLVLNEGQRYSMEVAAAAGAETLCPFFAPGFVAAAARARALGDARQLDEGEPAGAGIELCERLYPTSGPVGVVLGALRAGLGAGQGAAWLEDRFHDLALALAALGDETRREAATFPAVRRATREELYRRLHRARDFIWSCYAEPLSVAGVARMAALSPFHFHRSFRRAFGETPMQLLQRRRLDEARRLITGGEPVTGAALAVGFESLGSFSALFRRTYGVPPSALAKKQARRSVVAAARAR